MSETPVAFEALDPWHRAAILMDRTRRVIRDRVRGGEPADEIAEDFDVPVAFIEHLRHWQLGEDD